MPLDNSPTSFRPLVYVSQHVDPDKVSVSIGSRPASIHLTLTDAEARDFAAELLAAANRLPRIGTAADLGLEVLP